MTRGHEAVRHRRRPARWLQSWCRGGLLGLALLAALCPHTAVAQDPLFLINDSTFTRAVSFRFVDTQTFEVAQLERQIASLEPGFWDRMRDRFDWLPFVSYDPTPYFFDPVELQRDVVRLRRFYERNGFLDPTIDYPATQLDTARNSIHVIFTIREGPPLIIQDLGFFGPDGRYVTDQFDPEMQARWQRARDRILRQIGGRYTEAERLLVRGDVVTWLKDQGYAFTTVETDVQIDSSAYTADVRFEVDTGPMGYVDEIQIEGNESVSTSIVRREVPFTVGDRFSSTKLIQGQRELFGLNLFRLALADVPPQPRDSTVTVRFRVREAKPRYVSTQGGYGREGGLTLQADWRHRNFFGGARQFSVGAQWDSGLLASPTSQREPVRKFIATVSLHQPYLGSTRLSGFLEPFFTWIDDPNQLGASFYESGLNTTLLYEILPFRTLSLRHTFARAFPIGNTPLADTLNVYNRSVLSLSASLGRLNDYQNPRRGFIVRPFLEGAGGVFGSGIEYFKASAEVVGYQPLTRRVGLTARLSLGRLWPFGGSANQSDPETEFRFDQIRFYAGGATDVRGWATQQLGDKFARPTDRDTTRFVYEAVGGVSRAVGSVEVRWPFPFLSRTWGLATFLDAGYISGVLLSVDDGQPVLGKEKLFDADRLRLGTGLGVRYETPVGFLRFDLAIKVNPSTRDLQQPGEVYQFLNNNGPPPEERFIRRLNFHLSIGQTF